MPIVNEQCALRPHIGKAFIAHFSFSLKIKTVTKKRILKKWISLSIEESFGFFFFFKSFENWNVTQWENHVQKCSSRIMFLQLCSKVLKGRRQLTDLSSRNQTWSPHQNPLLLSCATYSRKPALAGGWTGWLVEIPSKPCVSVILWFCVTQNVQRKRKLKLFPWTFICRSSLAQQHHWKKVHRSVLGIDRVTEAGHLDWHLKSSSIPAAHWNDHIIHYPLTWGEGNKYY